MPLLIDEIVREKERGLAFAVIDREREARNGNGRWGGDVRRR